MRDRLRKTIAAQPLVSFVVLSYAISWTLVPTGGLLGCGPFIAAVLVLWTTEGAGGVRALLRRIVLWRIGWGWYALAVALPAGAALLAGVLTVGVGGAPVPPDEAVARGAEVPLTFLLVLLIPLFGPWEEPGFRGYALSRLSEHRSLLVAALIVGVIHVGFHLPLFLTGDIPTSDMVTIMAVGVVLAWLVFGSGGSVLVAMVAHAVNNAVSGEFVSTLFFGAGRELLGWIQAGIWCLFAAVVVLVAGRRFRVARARPDEAGPAATRLAH